VFYQFHLKLIKEKKDLTLRPLRALAKPRKAGPRWRDLHFAPTSGRETKKILPKRVQQREIKVMEAKIPIV